MILDELRADPGFDAIPASRGVNPDDGLEVAVRFKPAKGRAPG
jgi:hypothetical protein